MSDSTPPAAGTGCPAELTNICARRHWSLFWLFIMAAVALCGSRIATVGNFSEDGSPFFSANDRSRWCTIRSLGDEGTYCIDEVLLDRKKIRWDTIDRVRHVGADQKMHDYSSKPTLLPTLLAGKYWLLKAVTGLNLAEHPRWVVRCLLLLANLIPFAVYLWIFAQLINQIPVRDWTRYFMLIVAGFGTFLSTYIVSLNNHLPAAFSVAIALYCLFRIWKSQSNVWHFLGAGLFGSFAAANELPALSFCVVAIGICCWRSPIRAITIVLPACLLVGFGFFFTNFLAHGEWKPAYAHRTDGVVLASVVGEFSDSLNEGRIPSELADAIETQGINAPQVELGAWPATPKNVRRWVVRDQVSARQVAIVCSEEGAEYRVLAWNNWYDFPGSYWLTENDRKSDVDRGEPSGVSYLFHMLFGHHGIFSLTPIWILAFPGLLVLAAVDRFQLRWIGVVGLVLSAVVLAFYLNRPEIDRNYGGHTSGPRWTFWLIPLWLVGMLPVVDWLGKSKIGRWCCFTLLGVSILSVSYSAVNPLGPSLAL